MKLRYKILITLGAILVFFSIQIIFHIPYYSKGLEKKLKSIYKFFIPVFEVAKTPSQIDSETLEILQKGNNTIYMLHTYNHPPSGEDWERSHDLLYLFGDNKDDESVLKNTCLKKKGEMEAANIGKIFKEFNIPVGEVYVSPLCRNQQTAKLAFKKITDEYNFLLYPEIMNQEDIERNIKWTKELFNKKPKDGNKIIIGHGGILTDVLGFSEDINQSGMLVFNHDKKKAILKMDYIDIIKIYYLKE